MSTPSDLVISPPRGPEAGRAVPLKGSAPLPVFTRRERLIAVVGNPNSGKSTLFNRLTGLRQKVANYPGVTVDVTCGKCQLPSGSVVSLVDLPGAYSLRPRSPDEEIVRDVLLGIDGTTRLPDSILLVLDATSLDRQLFLALQVLDLGLPTLVVLNMVDQARDQGLLIDRPALERRLGVPIFETVGRTGEGIDALRAAMAGAAPRPATRPLAPTGPLAEDVTALAARLGELDRGHPRATDAERVAWALLCDESDRLARRLVPGAVADVAAARARITAGDPEWRSAEAARGFATVESIVKETVRKVTSADPVRRRVDRIVTHRVIGPILFALVMAVIFQAIYAGAQPVMDLMEAGTSWFGHVLGSALPEGPFRSLLISTGSWAPWGSRGGPSCLSSRRSRAPFRASWRRAPSRTAATGSPRSSSRPSCRAAHGSRSTRS